MKRTGILLTMLGLLFAHFAVAQNELEILQEMKKEEARAMEPFTSSLYKPESILWEQRIDSALYYEYLAGQWTYKERQVFLYNASFETTSWILSIYDALSSSWESNKKIDFVHDGNGDLKTRTTSLWDAPSSSWVRDEMYEYTYTSSGRLEEEVYSRWNASTSKWELQSRSVNTYDAQTGLRIDYILYRWDDVNKKWLRERRVEDFHDSMNRIDSSLASNWDSIQMLWVPESYNKFVWTSSNRISGFLSYNWMIATSTWEPGSRSLYTFDARGNTTWQRFQFWDNALKSYYTFFSSGFLFDSLDNVVLRLDSMRDFTTKTLMPSYRENYAYDTDNSLQSEIREKWDKTATKWIMEEKTDHKTDNRHHRWNIYSRPSVGRRLFIGSWHEVTGLPLSATVYNHDGSSWQMEEKAEYYYTGINTGIPNQNGTRSIVYPNPAKDQINLIFEKEIPKAIHILDIHGKVLIDLMPRENQLQINTDMSSGMYFIMLDFENEKETIKLIINK